MPIVRLNNSDARNIVDDYMDNRIPIAFELTVHQDAFMIIDHFDDTRQKGASIWVNALWEYHNAGHDDEKAVLDSSVYDWFIENNIDIIQIDRPQLLNEYL